VSGAGFQAPGINLDVGTNVITVFGTNLWNVVTNDSITIIRGGFGTGAPFINITNSDEIVSSDVTIYGISGTNNLHVVGDVVWTNSLTGASGVAQRFPGQWFQVSGIDLDVGDNVITVFATNQFGIMDNDSVTITREPVYQLQITFTNCPGSEVLTNFPALIRLNTSIDDFVYNSFLSTNGYDIRFWDASLKIALNYEIEKWDAGGDSYIWVQIPVFTNNSSIWATWRDENDQDQATCTTNGATWDDTFEAVWHMSEINPEDSSVNNHHGVNGGNVDGPGIADGAQFFDGISNEVKINDGFLIRGWTNFTIS
ncbi:MAG: DUF2341 domain-containing protein, partial [Planctomycetes bacterium]|nr:DUF2341 domain-containing protein [Planctomycetota bacterium]